METLKYQTSRRQYVEKTSSRQNLDFETSRPSRLETSKRDSGRQDDDASRRRGVEASSERLSSDDQEADEDPSGDEPGLFELNIKL